MTAIHKISDKSARIVIIDERSTVRQILVSVLRKIGFNSFNFFNNGKEAYKWLKREPVDWVIGTLKEADDNTLQLLEKMYDDEVLRKTRVSLLLNGEQRKCLPAAFEFGLLSWHATEYSFHYLESEFEELMAQIKRFNYNEPYVAGAYFRKSLRFDRNYTELTALEQGLATQYFRDYEHILRLAEAQFLAGRASVAKRTLAEAQYFDPQLSEQAARIYESQVGSTTEEAITFATRLGINSAVIVDQDEIARVTIIDALRKIGIENVESFGDGSEAWDYIKSHEEPQLIVQEWQIKGLAGPYLIQRIRGSGICAPIVIASSALERSDAQLVKEMFVSQVLKKPLRQKQLIMAVAWALKQYREPTEAKALERKVLLALGNGDRRNALRYYEKYKQLEDVSGSRKNYLEAAFLYDEKKFEDAVPLLVEAVSLSEGDNVDATALLSRALMKLGDFDASLALMNKASTLSPQNIERLCELAESHLSVGLSETAGGYVDRANVLDPGNERVKNTGAKQALATNDLSRAKRLMAELDSIADVIAFMNNRAVALIRKSEFKQGIDLYKAALKSIPNQAGEYAAVVHYNLALALVRSGDLQLASVYTKKAIDTGDTRVYDRSLLLRSRLLDAQNSGRTLTIGGQEAVLPDRIRKLVYQDLLGQKKSAARSGKSPVAAGEIALIGIYRETLRDSLARRYLAQGLKRRAS